LRAAILAAYDPAVLDKKFFFSGAPGQVALSPRDYYFHLLTDDDELLIKREAVRLISAQAEKGGTLSLNQLAIIRELMLDSVTPALLRPPLVLLLGDYYELFPVETVAVLKSVYAEGDEVSRAFAADILNKSGKKITAPAVSQEAWDEYYNN